MLVPPSNFGMVEEELYRSGAPDQINLPFLEKLQLKSLLWLAPEEPDRELQTFCATQNISLYHLGSLSRLTTTGANGNTSSSGGSILLSGGTGANAAVSAAQKALGLSSNNSSTSTWSNSNDSSGFPSLNEDTSRRGEFEPNEQQRIGASSSATALTRSAGGMAASSTIMGGGGAWEPITEDLVLSALQLLVNPSMYPAMVMCNQGRHRTGTVIGCLRKLQRWCLSSILEEYRRFAGPKVRVMNEQFIELFDIDLVFE